MTLNVSSAEAGMVAIPSEEASSGGASCRKGSPLSSETLLWTFGSRSQDRPTERGRLADMWLSLSVNSSRGELRIRRNSATASRLRLLDDCRLSMLLLMPLAALTMLGTRCVGVLTRPHANEELLGWMWCSIGKVPASISGPSSCAVGA